MKQLLGSKYLNHRNSRRKVEREEIESGVELQSRESEEEDSGLLNYKTKIKFLICIMNIEQFVFWGETIFTELFFSSPWLFDAR